MAPIDGGPSGRTAYIVTGPTAGIGRQTALDLARHGIVVLAGRDAGRLDAVRQTIERAGGRAVAVVCDLSDPTSVRRAAARIIELGLPIAGLLNNAGIMQLRPTANALGWDMTFATDHLGPFALTEALALAREQPRLRFNAVEPGFSPGTDLGRDSNALLRLVMKYGLSPMAPHIKYMGSPKSAARVIVRVLTDDSAATGVYYDERGRRMNGSALVREPEFQDRVVAEARALLAQVPA